MLFQAPKEMDDFLKPTMLCDWESTRIKEGMAQELAGNAKTIWFHPWCECYLSGKWLACDSVLDKALYDAAVRKGILNEKDMPTIDWDGATDLKTVSPWIIKDVGIHASYDTISRKVLDAVHVPGFMFNATIRITNRHINNIRHK